MAIGKWGQHWVEAQLSLENLDPGLLMWDMRRNLDPTPMPDRRSVIHFIYPEQPSARRYWWLVVEADADVDLCSVDPGFDVDLYATVDLRTMTAIWMGLTTVPDAVAKGKLISDRRPRARPGYADVAGPEPVRQREEARDGVRSQAR